MQDLEKTSKYFSYLLHHNPDDIGLEIDVLGWVSIASLIARSTEVQLTRELVEIVVETSDKQRFAISDDGEMIRANQGHSIAVDLQLEAQPPPQVLFHGTASRFLKSIADEGLTKQNRHYVHLTESISVAKAVGSRYGKGAILKIDSTKLFEDGFEFYQTANKVWLVDHVPSGYLTQV